jgi:hypothetical protein
MIFLLLHVVSVFSYGDGARCSAVVPNPTPWPTPRPPFGTPTPLPLEQVKKRLLLDCVTALNDQSATCQPDFTGTSYCCNGNMVVRKRAANCFDGTVNTGCMSCNDLKGDCVSACSDTRGCPSVSPYCQPLLCFNKIIGLSGGRTCTW